MKRNRSYRSTEWGEASDRNGGRWRHACWLIRFSRIRVRRRGITGPAKVRPFRDLAYWRRARPNYLALNFPSTPPKPLISRGQTRAYPRLKISRFALERWWTRKLLFFSSFVYGGVIFWKAGHWFLL